MESRAHEFDGEKVMSKKKEAHITPGDLDFIFDRSLVDEDEYGEFWAEWWIASPEDREKIIDKFSKKKRIELPALPKKGKLTKSRKVAEREAKAIGGYVVRRDRFGKYNRRGRTFQAIVHVKKSSKKSTKPKKK